jgi:hypothetical protein
MSTISIHQNALKYENYMNLWGKFKMENLFFFYSALGTQDKMYFKCLK